MNRPGLPHDALVYPCSIGQPMAETQVHGACMMYVTYALKRWFGKDGRTDVHVGMSSFLYYEQGNSRAVVAPDVYVVIGATEYHRDTYLLWNEPKGPDFVLEVTSANTRHEDERRKRAIYASLGVSEYFLYDPKGEYLTPALRGFRLKDGEYRALPALTVLPGCGMSVASEVLGLELHDVRHARALRLRSRATGQELLTYEESEAARDKETAARRREAEARRVEAVARRTAEARLELETAARQREATARREAEDVAKKLVARLKALETSSASTRETGIRKPVR